MSRMISGATPVAGVAGAPVRHSLSPLLHNAWLEAGDIPGVYVAFPLVAEHFEAFVQGLRGGAVRGLNVTIPFKEPALALADRASPGATAAGAANVLLFHEDGTIEARNTDGEGLIGALKAQAPDLDLSRSPVAMLGAGGAARGAAAALLAAGAPQVRIINRTLERAQAIAAALGPKIEPYAWSGRDRAFAGARLLVNATSLGLVGGEPMDIALDALPQDAVVMDMVYRPLDTDLLIRARASGRRTVDGLEMLIGQAIPAFEAFFGAPPPADVDARALALSVLLG
jgi:shikimate dehydrogenase